MKYAAKVNRTLLFVFEASCEIGIEDEGKIAINK